MRMREKKIGTITIGVDYETSLDAIALAEKYPEVWAGIGLHPTDNTKEVFEYEKYKILASHPHVVCIGECGLDYFRLEEPASAPSELLRAKQKSVFKKHIELAIEIEKPLMIHARPSKDSQDAYEDALEMLEEYQKIHGEKLRGNFHFFVGNIVVAKRALAIGFTMSFDGPITFSRDYDEVIKFLPLESIMAETDAPFAAPTPWRGRSCEPHMVFEIARKIAQIRGEDEKLVLATLVQNVQKAFGIKD